MERVLALGVLSPPCFCFIFPLGCLAGPVTSMKVGPPFSPSSSPFMSRASCRCGYRRKVISVCGLPHVSVSPVSTPWQVLSTFCPWASLFLPFSLSVGLGVCTRLLSILIPALSFSGLCPLRSLLLSPRHAYSVVRGLLPVGRFPWLVRYWLLRVPWSPSFSSVFLYGFLWPSRSPAGPGLPFPYAIWVLYPVGSSPSARVFPLCLFVFYHRVDVFWFLLSLQALVSQSTFACLSWVCSLSHALPPSLAAPFLRTVCSFFWGYFLLMAWVLAPSCLSSLVSGFAEWILHSVLSVCRRWYAFFLGSVFLLPGLILPLGLFSLPLLVLRSVVLFALLVSPASFP